MIEKIKNTSIELIPYPHMIIDNFLDENLFESIKKNWPSEIKHNDLRGSNLFMFSSELKNLEKTKNIFWYNFLNKNIHNISLTLANKFKKFFQHKLSSTTLDFGTGYTQTNVDTENQKDFAAHTHFDHDPLWVLTFLIYISDTNGNAPGTSLYTIGNNKKDKLNNFIKWNDLWRVPDNIISYDKKIKKISNLDFKLSKTVDFKKNRLFAFLDGPFSFHAVHYDKTSLPIIRNSIRFAVGITRSEIYKQYGIKNELWPSLFDGTNNKKLHSILKKEYNGYHPNIFNKIKNKLQSSGDLKLNPLPFF